MDNAVTSFVQLDFRTYAHVILRIFLRVIMQRTPCTQIAPSERCREHENLFRLFHNGIVNRYILACREQLVHHLLLLICKIIRKHTLKHLCHVRLIHTQRIHYSIYVPYKYTRIPEIILALQVSASHIYIRFFLKSVYTINLLIRRTSHRQIGLYISISGFRTSSLHTQSDDSVRIGSKFHSRLDYSAKLAHVHHYMVAWSHHNIRLRVTRLDFPAHVSYTRSGISAARLLQYMIGSYFGKLLFHHIGITG